VELVMLSALLGVGFYVTYTDIKLRLVSNRCTFSLLAVGLVGQLLMRYLEVTTPSRIVAVLLIALGIAVVLTLFGFWAPGDAKLFWAAVVALPPSLCPSLDPFSLQTAPVALILNALLCYVLVLLVAPLWRRDSTSEVQERPGGRQWLQAAWGLAGLLGLSLGFALLVLGRPLSYLEAFGALVIGYRLLERGLEVRYWPVILLPGLVGLCYLGLAGPGMREYVLLWGVAWLVEVVYLQVRHWYGRAFVQAFPVKLLQPGAIPRHRLTLQDGGMVCEAGKPLSEGQVRRLRELAGQGRLPGGQVLELEQAIPFVPFIVGAAILTASFAGNLVPPLLGLITWLKG
jgi:Flp pilus assembly protein protease CpaA